jgi:hypothetical protein
MPGTKYKVLGVHEDVTVLNDKTGEKNKVKYILDIEEV